MSAAMLAGFPTLAKEKKSKDFQPDTYAYTRGVEAYTEDKHSDAIEWFEKELKDHPDNGYAYLYLGTIYGSNEENGRALNALDKARKLLPKKDNVWRAIETASRAKLYLNMEDTVKALAEMADAIKLDPENTKYLRDRSDVYFEQKRYDDADADYRRMIALEPGDVVGYMGIGRNAKEQQRWDDAIQQFDYVIKLAPEYSSGYSFRAEANIGKEKWSEAADDIIKALDIDGDEKAFQLLRFFPAQQSQLMKTKLKIQMAKQPQNSYWPFCIATLASNVMEDYRDAITWYEKANSMDAHPVLLKNIARCHYNLHENAQALDRIETAIAMNPDDPGALDLKADILKRLCRLDEAIAEQTKIIESDPEIFFGYIERAQTKLDAHRYSDAIEDFNTAITVLPVLEEMTSILMKRGDAYRLSGLKTEADADYRRIIELEKDSTLSSSSNIQFAYSGLGEHDKAIETMKTILENDTTDSLGNTYNLACIYARAGRNKEAIDILKELITKDYEEKEHILTDYDLSTLIDEPEFKRISDEIRTGLYNPATTDGDEAEYVTEVVEVPFTKDGGVTKVRCSINDLPLHFVFDTGAADVTISMTEANFMLKNDYIKTEDIVGSARYMDANGDITEGTVINLRKVDFGGLELDNVRASVIRNQKAPLLLGQSVLGRLGSIEIDNPGMKLKITQRKRLPR